MWRRVARGSRGRFCSLGVPVLSDVLLCWLHVLFGCTYDLIIRRALSSHSDLKYEYKSEKRASLASRLCAIAIASGGELTKKVILSRKGEANRDTAKRTRTAENTHIKRTKHVSGLMSPNIKHARSKDQGDDRRLRVTAATAIVDDDDDDDSSPPSKANKNKANQSLTSSIVRTPSSQENCPPVQQFKARWRRRKENNKNNNNHNKRLRSIRHYIPPYLQPYILPYHGDFCVSTLFQSNLIAQVMAEGFLPIAAQSRYLLPKLHQERCVIDLPDDLHISKSIRKKAKKYSFTINEAMDDVIEGCRQQHGNHCWLYPPLVQAFQEIQQCGARGMSVQVQSNEEQVARTCPVRLYSVEVWEEDPDTAAGTEKNETTATTQQKQQETPQRRRRLVAGELGYSVGSIYTSLTGFSSQDSAGSIQLAALGRLLCQRGFTLWDLGMDMEYKRTMGSHLMPRDDFVQVVHEVRVRDQNTTLPIWDPTAAPNCRDIIDDKYMYT